MTPWVSRLLWANVGIFLLQGVTAGSLGTLWTQLAFRPSAVLLRPWSPVTYMFLHAGLAHLLFNMLVLFFFGPRLEDRLGGRRFLALYFLSGIAAAGLSFLTPHVLIVGASGAIYGVTLGFAYYYPRERIFIWGVIPIEARWLVAFMTALSAWGALRILGIIPGRPDRIAHFAHLGGFLGAWLYLKWMEKNTGAARFKRKVEGTAGKRGWRADRQVLEQWERIDPDALHEVNREAYERLARKIEREGIGSLTTREREFVERFSPD